MSRFTLLLLLVSSSAWFSCTPAWERCMNRGGRWYEGSMRLPPGERAGVCIQPYSDGGKPCRDGSECVSELCECPVREQSDSGPHEGSSQDEPLHAPEGTGTCATFPPASGSGWHCLVVKGQILEQGIIVD